MAKATQTDETKGTKQAADEGARPTKARQRREASEAASGEALEDQQVEGVVRPELAIGLVAKRLA
ncbi:MAG: hypothetical protein HUU18_12295, partial [Phycisphaerales bacterium]|nr:hypothetical protein [Phycisphaerales bacterium]